MRHLIESLNGLTEKTQKDPEMDAYVDGIVDAMLGERKSKLSSKELDKIRDIVRTEAEKKSEKSEELVTALIAGAAMVAVAVAALAVLSGLLGLFRKALGASPSDEVTDEVSSRVRDSSDEIASAVSSAGGNSDGSSGEDGDLPSKSLGNGKYEYKGKEGVWRTLKNGDRMFFPDDGSSPLGASATLGKAKKSEDAEGNSGGWKDSEGLVADNVGGALGNSDTEVPLDTEMINGDHPSVKKSKLRESDLDSIETLVSRAEEIRGVG